MKTRNQQQQQHFLFVLFQRCAFSRQAADWRTCFSTVPDRADRPSLIQQLHNTKVHHGSASRRRPVPRVANQIPDEYASTITRDILSPDPKRRRLCKDLYADPEEPEVTP